MFLSLKEKRAGRGKYLSAAAVTAGPTVPHQWFQTRKNLKGFHNMKFKQEWNRSVENSLNQSSGVIWTVMTLYHSSVSISLFSERRKTPQTQRTEQGHRLNSSPNTVATEGLLTWCSQSQHCIPGNCQQHQYWCPTAAWWRCDKATGGGAPVGRVRPPGS